jgi:hypothetical protein
MVSRLHGTRDDRKRDKGQGIRDKGQEKEKRERRRLKGEKRGKIDRSRAGALD